MDYSNKLCPVCKIKFTDEDDIVVCPQCGTPHHRECYKNEGKCFNEHLHNSQEDISLTFTAKEEKKTVIKASEEAQPENNENPSFDKKDEEGFDEFTKKLFKEKNLNFNPASTVLIEGRQAIFYDIAVRKNQSYYIPQFAAMSESKRKIISYNIMAFFVPVAWSVYRKMYKFALLFLALYMLILGTTGYFIFKDGTIINAANECYEEDPNFSENILLYMSQADVSLTQKQQDFIKAFNEATMPNAVSWVFTIGMYILRFVYALASNKLYMKEIGKTISKGEKAGLTDDKLKMYIYRKKGIVPFFICAIIGYFEAATFLF